MNNTLVRIALLAGLAIPTNLLAQDISASASAEINAIRAEKAKRTPAQRKLSSRLLNLAREVADSNAAATRSRVPREPDGRVIVDIAATPSAALAHAIFKAGGTVVYESLEGDSVQAILPPAAFEAIAARADVRMITPKAASRAHKVTNEADPAHKADVARAKYQVDGTGIKVGVISDSATYYKKSIASGELPAAFGILPGRAGTGSGEGTAMSEIIHDIAPGAEICFADAGYNKSYFADSIKLLKAAGCRIIVDDISFSTEWQFQDDVIGRAVNRVVADGAVYLSASGNEGSLRKGNSTTWEGDFIDGGESSLALPLGRVHSYGTRTFNRLTEYDSDANLQWSDEYHTSSNDYDLYILNSAGTRVVDSSTDTQDGSQQPFEEVYNVRAGERIVILKADSAEPRYLRLSCVGGPLQFATAGQSVGHSATLNCICVAATDATKAAPNPFTASSRLEGYSSDGPHKMFYKPNGTPYTPGNYLASGGLTVQSPSLTAGDGGKTSVPGFKHFSGTSASAPAAAAIAALVWSKNPALTNTQIRTILESSCIDIAAPGYENDSGYGILMATRALQNTPAAKP